MWIKLFLPKRTGKDEFKDVSYIFTWKHSGYIPSRTLFILFELVIIAYFSNKVQLPTTENVLLLRQGFIELFYPEDPHTPISDIEELNDYFLYLNNITEKANTDSLMHMKFHNRSNPVSHTIVFSNGTTKLNSFIVLDSSMVKSVSTITTSVEFEFFSISGCSDWTVEMIVSCKESNPAFSMNSKIHRDQCRGKTDNKMAKAMYRMVVQYSIMSIIFSVPQTIILIKELMRRIRRHRFLFNTSKEYSMLPMLEKFHLTIGYWLVIELFSSMFFAGTGIYIIKSVQGLTQYPSQWALEIWSVSAFLIIIQVMQFFKGWDSAYHFVAIVSNGFEWMVDVLLGMLPVVLAFMLPGIFMFVHIAPKTRTFWDMFEVLICFMFGDNIQPTYVEFSDGSSLFNWISFFYITALVLVAGWAMFASFTSVISFFDQTIRLSQAKKD